MAEFQFISSTGETFRRRSAAPNDAGSLWGWYKLAMKKIPTLPNPKKSGWQFKAQDATLETISYVLKHKDTGEECFLFVDRRIPGM